MDFRERLPFNLACITEEELLAKPGQQPKAAHRKVAEFIATNPYPVSGALILGVAVGLLAIHDHVIGVEPDVAAVVTPQIDKTRDDISETRAEILNRLDRMKDLDAKQMPISTKPPAPPQANQPQAVSPASAARADPPKFIPSVAPAIAAQPWSKRGFNAGTKANLPVAILAPDGGDPSHYRDQPAANDLSALLARDLHVVSRLEAALIIELSDVYATSRQSGQPCPQSYDSEWLGKASIKVRVLWTDNELPFFSGDFLGSSSACNEDAATEAARNDALSRVGEKLLTIAAQPP